MCKQHPLYQALRKPRGQCPECWAMWNARGKTLVEVFATEGYHIIKTPRQAVLMRGAMGVANWPLSNFGGRMPKLDHSLIREAIDSHRRLLAEIKSSKICVP